MATSTPNLNLTLPSSGDRVNVVVLNGNFEKLDDRLGGVSDSIIVDDLDPANMVHIEDAAARPAVELISYIEPYREGIGDPSINNVRTISGWSNVGAARTRKNMIPPLVKGVRIVSATGAETTNEKFSATPFTFYDGVSTVCLSGIPTTLSNFVAFYDAKKSFVGRTSGQAIATRQIAPDFVLNTGRTCGEARYLRLSVSEDSSVPGTLDDIDTAQIQLELGETATEYELYQGQTLTADLPETVYGGTLNWTTGMLVSTLDADGNELVEPKIIQLSPQQFNLLKGINNVWSNCGKTQLAYIADTKKYIDGKFAALAAAQLGV